MSYNKNGNPYFRSLKSGVSHNRNNQSYVSSGGFTQNSGINGGQSRTTAFSPYPHESSYAVMTKNDIYSATVMTILTIVVVAIANFFIGMSNPGIALVLALVGMIGGLITVIVDTFSKTFGSPIRTLIYAVFEGFAVGGFSFLFSMQDNLGGVPALSMVYMAISITLGLVFIMSMLYKTKIISGGQTFNRIIFFCISGILIAGIANFIIYWITGNGPLTNGGPIAIIFSLFCIVIASLSIVTDLRAADDLLSMNAPKEASWGVAMGFAVTVVWLYFEVLRLLSYLGKR